MTDTPPPKRKPRAKSATPAAPRYKMKELSARSGVPAPVVHFYIQQGLLPQGHKTGRNMAWYTDEHVQRIRAYLDLGFDHFVFHAPGPDQARFLELYAREVLPRLRANPSESPRDPPVLLFPAGPGLLRRGQATLHRARAGR